LGNNAVLVVGGGIAGMQASLDLADRGSKVYLVEKSPSIGGRMAQLDKTFPTMDCSICILAPKMISVLHHPNIKLLTYSEVKEIRGSVGNFKVEVVKKPRYVDESKCTGCDECTKECPVTLPNEFDMGLAKRKAIYRLFPQSVPNVFAIDRRGTPPCRYACPAGVNVQGYVALIADRKFKEAGDLIRRELVLPGVVGRVCFHPCENECERGKVDEPIAICALKRFAVDYVKKTKKEKPEPLAKKYHEKVAIIGSGPAGLAAAYELIRIGYSVTIFEKDSELGGMLRYAIPDYRLPKHVLDEDISYLKDLGVEIHANTTIGKDLNLEALKAMQYRAFFLAVGAQKSLKLGIEGENLDGVWHTLDFLRSANLGQKTNLRACLRNSVVVIGGGDAAVDSARTALRLGAKKATILYRRSRAEMPAHQPEVEEAEKEGVEIKFLVAPERILGKNGKVSAIECLKMSLGLPDETGRRRPIPVEGSEHTIPVGAVIIAIGQMLDSSALPEKIQVYRRTMVVDPVTFETNMPGVFAGGDAILGPASVIDAIACGKEAAISIHRYLRGEDIRAGRPEKRIKVEEVPKERIIKKQRKSIPVLPVKKRISDFEEVVHGYTEEMAVEEANRCLSCGGCAECRECEKACSAQAVDFNQKPEEITLNVSSIILATGLELYDPASISEYGYKRYKNVLLSLEFERLINASGPTRGELLRPSDNKYPLRIVFVQCVGSRTQQKGLPYCSSVCCMYATKEAILVREHNPRCEVYILYMDLRVFGKRFQEFVSRARDKWGVKYVNGRPCTIVDDPATQDLLVRYQNIMEEKIEELRADLVVLCPALIPREDNKVLAEILDLELDGHNFFRTEDPSLMSVETNVPGVFVCGYCQAPKDISESVTQASAAAARAAEAVVSNIAGG
jgi:heterodisulfide reductase subunit A-like polyferredoxin